jgi:hypothetical protein
VDVFQFLFIPGTAAVRCKPRDNGSLLSRCCASTTQLNSQQSTVNSRSAAGSRSPMISQRCSLLTLTTVLGSHYYWARVRALAASSTATTTTPSALKATSCEVLRSPLSVAAAAAAAAASAASPVARRGRCPAYAVEESGHFAVRRGRAAEASPSARYYTLP